MGKIIEKLTEENYFLSFLLHKKWWFFLAGLLFLLFSVFIEKYSNKFIYQKEQNELEVILRERSKLVLDYLKHNQEGVLTLAKEISTIELIQKLTDKTNIESKNTSEKTHLNINFENFFSKFKKNYALKNVIFISKEGDIVYSSSNKIIEISQNLIKDDKYIPLILKKSFMRSRSTLTIDISEFGFDPILQSPILYLTAPVFKENQNYGFISVLIDHNEIYNILNNFEGLGKTGEITLGKFVENNVILSAPTRKSKQEEFKNIFSMKSKRELALLKASQDEIGSGFYQDYLGDNVYAVWNFLPHINLGIVIKKDVSEIESKFIEYNFAKVTKIILLLLSFIFILLSVYGFCLISKSDITYKKRNSIAFKRFLLFLIFVSTIIITATILSQYYVQQSDYNKAQYNESNFLNIAQEELNHSLKTLADIGHSLAEDFYTERLKPSELNKRLERDLEENKNIHGIAIAFQPYSFDPNKDRYAPFFYKKNNSLLKTDFASTIDYIEKDADLTPWYKAGLESKTGAWSQLFHENVSRSDVVFYAVPFYAPHDKERLSPIGVIVVFYPSSVFQYLIRNYETGTSGYYFLLTEKSQFLSHPVEEYVKSRKSIFDLAKEIEIQELIDLGKNAQLGKAGNVQYRTPDTDEIIWINYKPISGVNWTLSKVAYQKDLIKNNGQLKTEKLVILLELIILFIFLSFLFGKSYKITIHTISISLSFSALILFISNLVLCFWIYQTSEPHLEKETQITDSLKLNTFIDEQMQKADLLFAPKPYQTNMGIYIDDIDIKATQGRISFGAKIWQKIENPIPENHKFGFTFPQFSTFDKKEIHQSTQDSRKTILWDSIVELFYPLSFKDYPFDSHVIKINIEPEDTTENIFLAPDLSSYRFVSPHLMPGIRNNISIPGFKLSKSLFAYDKVISNTNFGIENYSKSKEKNRLNYIIILKRNILDSIVSYFIPLCVILLISFSLLMVLPRKIENGLIILPALIFTTVLLHRNLRINLGTSDIAYIEYLFFITYIVLLLILIYSVFLHLSHATQEYKIKFNVLISSFFWPITLSLWLFSTIYIFYLS